MSSALDMSLDDIIKSNKKSSSSTVSAAGSGGGGGGIPRDRRRSAGSGPTRRFPNRSGNRPAPYSVGKAPESAWQHDMYTDHPAPAGRASAIETGTKLYISNLDYGVSNEDIKELFSEVGDLKRYTIHYDRSGRSKGTAEVVFARRADALAAVKRYNSVQLDGKRMQIEIVGRTIPAPSAVPPASNGVHRNLNGAPMSGPRSNTAGLARRGGRGRGRRGGRGKDRAPPVSTTDLDADLEKYHAEAMQTN
ncbi:THO complex subunit 4B-like [Typha angustifolia]|uniref:THO complex subunit 4B-like n=1 Tax=Typha angustifolia TaxID=59011 RepID=UPI003C2AC620